MATPLLNSGGRPVINGVSLITNGSGTGAKPEEEEIIDVTAFQAQLDDSVASARALVASWVPKNLGPSWDTPSTSSSSLASLAARGRPTRMGLGADPTVLHKQQAEERKLRDRLMRGAAKPKGEVEIQIDKGKGKDREKRELAREEDDDEEDSRSHVIKRKRDNDLKPSTTITGNATSNPFVLNSSTPLPSLHSNLSTPSGPLSPSAPKSSSQPKTKNQRRKERDRLAKRARTVSAASRIEGGEEGDLEDAPVLATPNSPSQNSLRKQPRNLVKPPFAPLTSPSSSDETVISRRDSAEKKPSESPEPVKKGDNVNAP